MECPKCGNEVKDSDKKCPYCGKVLQLECQVCHKFNRSSVCEECGNVIIVKCHECGTTGPNTGKCRKCGFPTAKSVIMNEAESEEYACLAITFPNLEDLRPALKNKTIFNKFKKKLKQALFGYAKSQDNRAQMFGEAYVIKYYKEFSLTSSVKKAVKSAIELLNKIGGISYKLKKSKNVRLHCKMTILKKTFETDTNEFNTGLNIKLIKDNTEEKYTDGLQLITDQYVNNIISREYTLEMIYSSQVGDELLMFYEFPLEDQIIPVVEEEKPQDSSILKGPKELPKLKIEDDIDSMNEMLYGNKAIDISTEGQFLSIPANNLFNTLDQILGSNSFVTIKTNERRSIPTSDILNFLNKKSSNVLHVVCSQKFPYKPYSFFRELIARIVHVDEKQADVAQKVKSVLSSKDPDGLLSNLITNTKPSDLAPDQAYEMYRNSLREFLASNRNATIFIENFDVIDETSRQVIIDYISTLVNLEDLGLSFVVTVPAEYSVYKNIPKLLHSQFYKEINVTRGDFEEFIANTEEDLSEIKESFYIKKLEERTAGSLIYFKNALQYMQDSNVFVTFEGKLIVNAEKTIVFPGTISELFARRFAGLPESEGLVIAYTILLGGYAHQSLLEKLNIENLGDAIQSLVNKSLISFNDSIVFIDNYRIFNPSLQKSISTDIKQTLAKNIMENLNIKNFAILDIMGFKEEKLNRVYESALNSLSFGDFDAYLNCAKSYFELLEILKIKDGEAFERKNELYSILVSHLNRYPSTKVYTIAKSILANATKNNDDETIVNVSNLILDSALNGHDYVLAQQCLQNILTRILNPSILEEGQDYSSQYLLYSCIYAKVTFHLAKYSQCVAICEKILATTTPEFIENLVSKGINKDQFMPYLMETLVYAAFSKIITCNDTLVEFLDDVKEKLGTDFLSREYLIVLQKMMHLEPYDMPAGEPSDMVSTYIANMAVAFSNIEEGFNAFAQSIYKAKMAALSDEWKLLSLICDLFIGYSYQKITLEQNSSWKKCETIYDDVAQIARRSGLGNVVTITNWFKGALLKDKGLFEEAYDLITSVINSTKHSHLKNRLLVLMSYILSLNIICKLPDRKTEIPIIIYRIKYIAEKYKLENYYKFIEDQNLLDPEYMKQFQEEIEKEKAVIEEEKQEEIKADEQENSEVSSLDVPQQ